ncbi:MAG: PEP/pyruvate-binding domain-containing protein [Xanthobacteraceae bacterium]
MSTFVIPGSDARDVGQVGGKAAALGDLVRAGFDVPAFLVITPDAFSDSGLNDAARDLLAQLMPALGPGPYAVRSSGSEEDGSAHSYAGQFLSFLGVAAPDVAEAALKVWRSGSTESLRAYRSSRGLAPDSGAPAVIVQRLVRARAAGVAFSADPVSGRRDRIVVAATSGLGDRLAGGEADGENYVIDRASGASLQAPEGGVLAAADLAALVALVVGVENARGAPQDIEWALEADQLSLLQARPITTALRPNPIGDPVVTIFDNSNIIESYPGLVSPLTYSFAQYIYSRVYPAFVALLGVDAAAIRAHGAVFDNMLGRVDGRVYYNLINWYRALALIPGFAINRAYMETMMGVDAPLPPAITDTIGPRPAHGFELVREYGRLAKVALGLLREAIRLPRTSRAFYARLESALSTPTAAIETMPLTALAGEYRRVEAQLLERWDAPLINDFLCMIAFGASRKLLERWGGRAGLDLHNEIMIGQGDIISAEPAQRIAHMGALAAGDPDLIAGLARGERAALARNAALATEVESYLAKFGDRCTEELKLESIPLSEDPRPLLVAIAGSAQAEPRAPRAASRDSIEGLFPDHPLRRWIAQRVTGWAKARVRDRENLRFERTRIFGRARRVLLAMGRELHAHGVIDAAQDVFFLTVPEVLGAVEGFATSFDLKGLAAVRKAEMARAATLPHPPERITITGAAICRSVVAGAARAEPSGERSRTGIGCCAGTVRAPARVIRDPRNEALERGEVLVARHTDPGWIALFSNASAIVVERGSLLSHSAIVARELGIPCVVGIKGALEWLATGDRIEVDGLAGTVSKLDA